MTLLALSAGFVGFIHSLSPSHWLPVVLLGKARNWPLNKALLAALIASSGHIFLSLLLGGLGIGAGAHFLVPYEAVIEQVSGLVLILFGIGYALYSYSLHRRCEGHTHHGPESIGERGPLLFLFSLGFSPCIAVFPLFVAAAPHGSLILFSSMFCFAIGVVLALCGATLIARAGLMKLDHPFFEHYGDVMAGLCVALMGVLLFLFPD